MHYSSSYHSHVLLLHLHFPVRLWLMPHSTLVFGMCWSVRSLSEGVSEWGLHQSKSYEEHWAYLYCMRAKRKMAAHFARGMAHLVQPVLTYSTSRIFFCVCAMCMFMTEISIFKRIIQSEGKSKAAIWQSLDRHFRQGCQERVEFPVFVSQWVNALKFSQPRDFPSLFFSTSVSYWAVGGHVGKFLNIIANIFKTVFPNSVFDSEIKQL